MCLTRLALAPGIFLVNQGRWLSCKENVLVLDSTLAAFYPRYHSVKIKSSRFSVFQQSPQTPTSCCTICFSEARLSRYTAIARVSESRHSPQESGPTILSQFDGRQKKYLEI